MHVLLVEDEDAIADPLAEGLRREGFTVTRAATGAEALAASESDVVLLDLRLPDIDGLDVCRKIRERSDVPIIVVTARGEEADRVVGLELGADDYVVKPFGIRELIARIRAVTRRGRGTAPEKDIVQVGELELDGRARRVRLGSQRARVDAERVRPADCPGARSRRGPQPPAPTRRSLGDKLVWLDEDHRRSRCCATPQARRP